MPRILKKDLEEIIKQKDEHISRLYKELEKLQFQNEILTKTNERRFVGEDSLLAMSRAVDATAHVVGDLRQTIFRLEKR